jgi:hypothetical protein
MSEAVLYGEGTPRRALREPAYGDNRLRFEPPPKVEERLDRRAEIALAVGIVAPAIAAYGAAAYAVYRCASALI